MSAAQCQHCADHRLDTHYASAKAGGSKPLIIHGSLPTLTLDPCPRCFL
jgi:hypothetical protein